VTYVQPAGVDAIPGLVRQADWAMLEWRVTTCQRASRLTQTSVR
jgi:hypothetical protein